MAVFLRNEQIIAWIWIDKLSLTKKTAFDLSKRAKFLCSLLNHTISQTHFKASTSCWCCFIPANCNKKSHILGAKTLNKYPNTSNGKGRPGYVKACLELREIPFTFGKAHWVATKHSWSAGRAVEQPLIDLWAWNTPLTQYDLEYQLISSISCLQTGSPSLSLPIAFGSAGADRCVAAGNWRLRLSFQQFQIGY